jgi:hypothetical protein
LIPRTSPRRDVRIHLRPIMYEYAPRRGILAHCW